MLKFSGRSDIKFFVRDFLQTQELAGQRVIDVPAGKGVTSKILDERGADVVPYDLFPEVFEYSPLTCKEADLMEGLPEESGSADMLICQEGLEHLPNQLAALGEFNRVLKKNGRLLITVPNISHLRGKISNLLVESELYGRMSPNELDALWFAKDGKMYFGHIFLIGIQRLRVLAVASGFRLKRLHTVKASKGSLLYFPLYPLVFLVNGWSYLKNVYRNDGIDRDAKKRVYGEQFKLNIHPAILFGRHVFAEFEKIDDLDELGMEVVTARY